MMKMSVLVALSLSIAAGGLAAINACSSDYGSGADYELTDAPARDVGRDSSSSTDSPSSSDDSGDGGGDASDDAPACAVAIPPSGGAGNSVVHVRVMSDAGGAVSARRNGALVGQTVDEMDVVYMKGDEFSFAAIACDGHPFVRFCADPPACALATAANPFNGTISADSGTVAAQFK
jgi:hypothetical protein